MVEVVVSVSKLNTSRQQDTRGEGKEEKKMSNKMTWCERRIKKIEKEHHVHEKGRGYIPFLTMSSN